MSYLPFNITRMIEFAKIMSPQELKDFYQNILNTNNNKKDSSEISLNQNHDLLVQSYYDYEEEQIKIFSNQRKEITKSILLWNNKECCCGKKLRLIESAYGTFWGCPNYSDKSTKHITLNTNEGAFLEHKLQNTRIRINAHWATDILRKTKLDKFIKAKELITFYINYGYEDLREKYGYKPTIESISGYVNAKIKSRIEEKEITEHLTNLFSNSKPQIGINYKLENQNPKVAIIDLILSNDETVYVVEIKRSNYDIKLEQLKLYYSLICFILKENSDERKCKATFLIYNKEVYSFSNDEKYVVFNELEKCKCEKEIIEKLEENCQINGR